MRSLLPESKKSKTILAFTEINGIRNYPLNRVPAGIREEVRKLELGHRASPVILIDQDYNLVVQPENLDNWAICFVAQISTVEAKICRLPENAFADNREELRMRNVLVTRPRFFDENQLDGGAQDTLPVLEEEEEEVEDEAYLAEDLEEPEEI